MIEKRLREYKSDLSKLHLIECKMQRAENDIQLADPSYISATQYSVTPKSVTNKFSSIVENSVLEIEKNREELERLKADLWDDATKQFDLRMNVKEIESLLDGLPAEERLVIESYYFDGLTWPMIANKYQEQFHIYKTPKTLKHKRNEALQKMEKNLSVTTKVTKSPV